MECKWISEKQKKYFITSDRSTVGNVRVTIEK